MFRLDSGKFPKVNYNRVLAKARNAQSFNPSVTQANVMGMYRVSQDMNSLREPQLAIRKPQGKTRDGLI